MGRNVLKAIIALRSLVRHALLRFSYAKARADRNALRNPHVSKLDRWQYIK
jgi:hypothetical protein